MPHPETQPRIAELLDAGRCMLEYAERGDWESVDDLQQQCDQLAQDLFSSPPRDRDAAACAAAIGELLEINQRIVDLGRNAREICLDSVSSVKRSRKAIREYTANAE